MAESDRIEHHECHNPSLDICSTAIGMKPQDAGHTDKINEILASLSQHIQEEEDQDLPALEDSLKAQPDLSESIARSFGRTKAFVPSRSHPSAGKNPPFETVIGLLAAPIGHVADIFRKFPDNTISPNPSTK
ncbi:MAG: hypothetical protein M1820_003064 [Bogoriella megaspora]|nr:MAG: hypothetical protein M1820_003064 [Bogoriella megaspora]